MAIGFYKVLELPEIPEPSSIYYVVSDILPQNNPEGEDVLIHKLFITTKSIPAEYIPLNAVTLVELKEGLNTKFDVPVGTIYQYLRGDGTLGDISNIPSYSLKVVLFEPQILSLEEQGQVRDNIGVSSVFKEKFIYNSISNTDQKFQLLFIPTNVLYITDTGSFIQGSDVGKNDYSINTATSELTINVELKDGAEIIICYEHQNQLP